MKMMKLMKDIALINLLLTYLLIQVLKEKQYVINY